MASKEVEKVLAHHGVKGQKWGIRRARASLAARNAEARKPKPVAVTTKAGPGQKTKIKTTGGESHPAHPDAIRARSTARVSKKSGLNALSDKELQAYASRLDLEMRVTRLEKQSGSGKGFVARWFSKKENQDLAVSTVQKQGPKVVAKAVAIKAAKTAATAAV